MFDLDESSAEKSARWASIEAGKLSRFENYKIYFSEISDELKRSYRALPKLPDWARFDFSDLKKIDRELGGHGQKFLEDSLRRVVGEGADMFKEIHVENIKDIAGDAMKKLGEMPPLI